MPDGIRIDSLGLAEPTVWPYHLPPPARNIVKSMQGILTYVSQK